MTSIRCTTTGTSPCSGGSKDIFLNILTTTGLVQRYVTDWAGPEAIVRAVSIRLGVPCYAGDTLTFSGRVRRERKRPRRGEQVITVTGRCSLGQHVTGTVPARASRERAVISGAPAFCGTTAIAGIGATEFSKESGRSELKLAVEAVRAALDDAGLTASRRGRPGDVQHGQQRRDRGRPRARRRRADLLQPDRLRRRARPARPCTRPPWRSRPVRPPWSSATGP